MSKRHPLVCRPHRTLACVVWLSCGLACLGTGNSCPLEVAFWTTVCISLVYFATKA
ncbi:MAG: hypothetical protein HN742_10840 [Lentisphaerae bacterium]|jgi:hypothetical protein|nr:hypothetical protein [Lentisphaerota bacterium]MBT7056702.1 hypothetical protein [Lentisphaerota bacterium]MBT7842360.1 hypothetical protein [Lentisphaerota bacterium]